MSVQGILQKVAIYWGKKTGILIIYFWGVRGFEGDKEKAKFKRDLLPVKLWGLI